MTTSNGRVVLVTGGGRGIGHFVALAFAAEGDRVVVNDVRQHELGPEPARQGAGLDRHGG